MNVYYNKCVVAVGNTRANREEASALFDLSTTRNGETRRRRGRLRLRVGNSHKSYKAGCLS